MNLTAVDLFCTIETAARTEWQVLRRFLYVSCLENLLRDFISPPFVELPEDWDEYLHGRGHRMDRGDLGPPAAGEAPAGAYTSPALCAGRSTTEMTGSPRSR